MGALDTAKEFVRIGSTAGLSKDVIDLLQTKSVLLTEQVATLEKEKAALSQENTVLLRENRNLKLENESLKNQLENTRPKGDKLDEICEKMLTTLANVNDRHGITDGELINHLRLPKAKGDYHFDQLRKRKFVDAGSGQMGRGMFWYVTAAGRDYMARHELL